jgi:hypothetical protein
MTTFDQHDMQLAATRDALEPQLKSHPRCAIVFVSRTHPGACSFAEIPEPKLVRGMRMFDALADLLASNATTTARHGRKERSDVPNSR